jgi:hypothetical protein
MSIINEWFAQALKPPTQKKDEERGGGFVKEEPSLLELLTAQLRTQSEARGAALARLEQARDKESRVWAALRIQMKSGRGQ